MHFLRRHLGTNDDMEIDVRDFTAPGLEVVKRLDRRAPTKKLHDARGDLGFQALVHDDVEALADDADARDQHEEGDADGDHRVDDWPAGHLHQDERDKDPDVDPNVGRVVHGVRLHHEAARLASHASQVRDRPDREAEDRQHDRDPEERVVALLADQHLVDRLVDDEEARREDEAALEHGPEAFDLRMTVVVLLVGRAVTVPDDEEVRGRDDEVPQGIDRRREQRHAPGHDPGRELRERPDGGARHRNHDGSHLGARAGGSLDSGSRTARAIASCPASWSPPSLPSTRGAPASECATTSRSGQTGHKGYDGPFPCSCWSLSPVGALQLAPYAP